MLSDVRATPYSLHPNKQPEIVIRERVEQHDELPRAKPEITRRLYLRPTDFIGEDGHGLTPGSPKTPKPRSNEHFKSIFVL